MRPFLMMLLLAVPFMVPDRAWSQQVAAGDRIQLRIGRNRIDGLLVSIADSVLIRSGTRIVSLPADGAVLYRHAGHRPAGEALLRGVGTGTLVGFTAGAIWGLVAHEDNWLTSSPGESALLLGTYAAIPGAVIGAIGGLASAGNRWELVGRASALRVGMSGSRSGPVALSVRLPH